MILKFNLKKLSKLAAVGAASLALIVPLSMNSGTVANAAEGPYYYDDGELVYNGFTNEDGYWIGSKRDKWLYDNGLLDPDGDYSDEYDVVNDYAHTYHVNFMHALKLYRIMDKMPAKDFEGTFHGKPIESDEDAMAYTDAIMHHKYPNRANNHHAIKRRGKRTSRKPHKKNVRRPKPRRGKRTAAKKQPERAKRSKKRGKRTIKARRTRKAQKKHKTRRIRR